MRLSAILCLALAACSAAAGSDNRAEVDALPAAGTIWHVETREQLDRAELARRLSEADVSVLGEVHDNAAHHVAQAWLVGQLEPTGIAFEMIPTSSEEGIAVFLADGGAPAEIGPAIGWESLGWPDWALYRPIFEAWRADVYTGGGVSRGVIRQAIANGAASQSPDDRFAPVLSASLAPAVQSAMEDEMIAAHCDMLPASAAPGMVEGQRLRDASFAAAALRAHAATGGGRIVLITGNGHARTDRGVPSYLAAVAPGLAVASVGILETRQGAQSVSEHGPLPYDYVWFTAPAERGDPCAAFG